MTSLGQWAAWIVLTVVWNAINSANSRAKNSSSWRYNAATTLLSSALYIASLLLVGNQLLAARAGGRGELVLVAVVLYALASGCGSVAGQVAAMRLESRHRPSSIRSLQGR